MNDKLKENLERVAAKTGLASAIDLLLGEARECAYIFNDDGTIQPGDSRIGGVPDLPTNIQWPAAQGVEEDVAASFLAQISLSQVPSLDQTPLPRDGWLWFFLTSWPERGPEVGLHVYHAPAQ